MARKLLFVTALVAACGGGDASPDQTVGVDAGTPADASSGTDAGTRIDAGASNPDTGTTPVDGSAADSSSSPDAKADANQQVDAAPGRAIKTVFVIVMENHDWSEIKGSSSAPYINNTLLTAGAHAEGYKNPPGLHPSEPNYLWMEAGSNLGITDDNDPSSHHLATTEHLVTQLKNANIPWKAYAEGIPSPPTACPLSTSGKFAPKHVPFLFFDDVTDGNSTTSASCMAHVRAYSELAADLTANTVARYNFIVPDLCHDMHGALTSCPPFFTDLIKDGDTWLSQEVPRIQASAAYADGGAIFIVWDEGTGSSDGPVGMIVLSKAAKTGYSNTTAYTHSSLVRTMQTVFGVSPFLGGAATATDLGDLFQAFP